MTPPPNTSALVSSTDSRRRSATSELNQDTRSDLGQFLTPPLVARFMAGMFGDLPEHLRLLDAGAGIGSLTAAFVAEVCSRGGNTKSLAATAFEIDPILAPHLRDTFSTCERACTESDIEFEGYVYPTDFLETAVASLEGSFFASTPRLFNAAILNPPYRKIGTDSRERRLVQRAGLDATNLYAAFVALAVRLLEPGGQLVAIVPRSFCNGPYFRPFREMLLQETALLRLHVFDSRKDAFKEDGVLQENIIIHTQKSTKRPAQITVSSSGRRGNVHGTERVLSYGDVIRSTNGDQFIHLPTDAEDDQVASWMNALPETLASIGMSVSTGRVVDFRAREFLRQESEEGTVPLIYACHFSDGRIQWPKKESRKPNALVQNTETQSLLVPRGFYVVTKRFSSKEERRRLVAAVYDPQIVTAPKVGFENHLNYFHREGEGLSEHEAFGLCAFLNSSPIDKYFRQFNGHTQVNATDLRSLRYPSRDVLRELGEMKLSPGSPEIEVAILKRYPRS